jgi:hypothetical protein
MSIHSPVKKVTTGKKAVVKPMLLPEEKAFLTSLAKIFVTKILKP